MPSTTWFCDRLKQMKDQGKTQVQLAERLGLEEPRISDIKAGRRRIQANEIEPLAAFFEWPTELVAACVAAPEQAASLIEEFERTGTTPSSRLLTGQEQNQSGDMPMKDTLSQLALTILLQLDPPDAHRVMEEALIRLKKTSPPHNEPDISPSPQRRA